MNTLKNFLIISGICFHSILTGNVLYAQGGGTGSTSPVALEKIIPPSPEAATLGKYGTFPVGLFTGTPNVTIELYRLKTKHLQLPVSINYSSNGIKVNDMATKIGMSWALNAGGAITRTIYDKPDEKYLRASPPPSPDLSSTTSSDLTIPAWVEQIEAQHEDTQFDEYSFNFNGYTGKFIIDLNNNPVLIPYSNIKIELNPFKITTADGIQYYFGENGATENSQTFNGSCSKDDTRGAACAWYLTRIIDPNDPSDTVRLSYFTGGYSYLANISHTITYWDNSNTCTGAWSNINPNTSDPCGCGPTPCIYGGKGSPNLTVDNFCSNNQGVSVPYLSEITSSLYGKIKFIYDTSYSTGSNSIATDRLLKSISVFQNNNGTNLLKSYNFIYTIASPDTHGTMTSLDNIAVDLPDTKARPFLSTLQELDSTNTVVKYHSFEYNDMTHLTARLSSSQDAWGYYNGKSNPHSLVPSDSSMASTTLLPLQKIADRTPDYTYAMKGILTKVNFPTGGNVQFVYEGNALSQPPSSQAAHYAPASSVQASNTSSSATFYIMETTTISVTRNYYCCSGGTNTCAQANNTQVWAVLNMVQNGVSTPTNTYTFAEYNTRGECSYSKTDNITLQPGTYGLSVIGFDQYQLSIVLQATSGTIYTLDAYVPTTKALVYAGGGLRVKQQITYDPVSQQSTTTNYQYSGMIFPYTPRFVNNISYRHTQYSWADNGQQVYCVGPVDCGQLKSCNYIQFSSNSSINSYGRGGSPVYYTAVTESTGDNYVLGGIEHTYFYHADANLNQLRGNIIAGATSPSYSWKNGLELNRNVFKFVNGNKVYLKKTTNTYTDDSRITNTYTQYITKQSGVNEIITPSGTCPATSVFNRRMDVFDILSYTTSQLWTYLSSTQEDNFDMNGNNPLTTITNFNYDNPVHAMISRTIGQNSKGQTVQTTMRYPADSAAVTNLSPAESMAIHALLTQNSQATVVESEQLVNNNLVSRVHTGYTVLGGGLVKPQVIKEQIGSNPIESRIQFQQYDNTGNLLTEAKANDINTSYIWDYKSTYPIAEVKNALASDISYTSFEADGTGNWMVGAGSLGTTGGITGNNFYSLSSGATITKSGLNASKSYFVTYWSKNGPVTISGSTVTTGLVKKGWTFYQHTLAASSTSVSVTGSGISLDELRLYPTDAQMTTYTYTPLVGMTSSCSVNSLTTYYEYDGLNRLLRIRDLDGNIIKQYDYQYQVPYTHP